MKTQAHWVFKLNKGSCDFICDHCGTRTMDFKKLKDLDLKNKTVLLRLDLNVPKQDGKVTDSTRIDRAKPTIDHLIKAGAKTLILSHFGRPKGERDSALSLAFLIPALEKSWNTPIKFSQDCTGDKAQAAAANMKPGDITLLENVRFHKGEKDNDPAFINELAALGDLYINDAFSVSHRAHASTTGLANKLPSSAGILMEQELSALNTALEDPEKPLAAIVGGSKISTKLSVLHNLIEKTNILILGGGMANTFLYAQGAELGASLFESDMKNEACAIIEKAKKIGCQIILPSDFITVTEISHDAETKITSATNVPKDRMAIDIGPETIKHIETTLEPCKTVIWNGPMGVFEIKPFDNGTNAVAQLVADRTRLGQIISVAGGGDTVAALENAQVAKDFTYISTAGGAFLEWLEGKTLPGVAALMNS